MITTHPGEYLAATYLGERGHSSAELADMLDVSESTVSRLIHCKSDVTPEMALRLERLGPSAEMWMSMQTRHSLSEARKSMDAS
ncbi:MAG: HigA family addiction module antitoxin [Phycisphaerae bacterium]